jgi:hypothetical protein
MGLVSGCGPRGAVDLSLDKEVARESLTAFLEAWKGGKKPADLQNQKPPIIVGEQEWESGTQLVSYELVGDEIDAGANLHASAELTLKRAEGSESRQRVEYVIGTEPAITIFRAQ